MSEEVLLNKIIEVLPQLQCKKCEYPDCRSYAKSIIDEKEKTNKCEPGGVDTEKNILYVSTDQSPYIISIFENKFWRGTYTHRWEQSVSYTHLRAHET